MAKASIDIIFPYLRMKLGEKKMMEKKDKKEAGEGRAGEGGRVVAGGL